MSTQNILGFQYEALCHRKDGCLAVLGSTLSSSRWTGCIQVYPNTVSTSTETTEYTAGTGHPVSSIKSRHTLSFCENSSADMTWFDEDNLLVGSDNGELVVWLMLDDDCSAMKRTTSFLEHNNLISSLDVNRNKIAASGSSDKSIKLWDIAKETSIATLHKHSAEVTSLKWNPTEMNMLISTSSDGSIAVSDMRESSTSYALGMKLGLAATAVTNCSNVNGSQFAIGFENGSISLFDIRQANEIVTSTNCVHKRWITRLLFYKDSKIISASDDCSVSVIDINTSGLMNIVYKDYRHNDFAKGLSCLPEKNSFMSCGWDSQIIVHYEHMFTNCST
ncbi:Methylosome protein 50 [Trichoplax sp. H2]|nr:Methylosome protein 50 [Trichoplax sp. H2]|eukprot:RDD45724.1 Methylosome protein 50 [Trichoplax sp. H2]